MRQQISWLATGILVFGGCFNLAQLGVCADPAENSGGASKDHQAEQSPGPAAGAHRAALGIALRPTTTGIFVATVIPGSPAEQAGLQSGDEIRRIGGERVHSIPEFVDEIRDFAPGSEVELHIRRNGERLTVKPKLAPIEQVYDRHQANYRAASGAGAAPPALVEHLQRQVEFLQQEIARQQQIIMQLQTNQNQRIYSQRQAQSFGGYNPNGDHDPALFQ